MARVALATTPEGVILIRTRGGALVPAEGALLHVYERGTETAVTVYKEESGGRR